LFRAEQAIGESERVYEQKESVMSKLSRARFQVATPRVVIGALLIVVGLMGIARESSAAATIVPVATNDEYSVTHDQPLVVSAPGVLANDVLPPGPTWGANLVDFPLHGTFNLNANGGFDYTPNAGYVGDDSFIYGIYNGSEGEPIILSTATVTIHVTNLSPTPVDDAYSTLQDTVLNVPAAGVLANDLSPDSDPIQVNGVSVPPSHGTLNLNPDGSFDYTPDTGYFGIDTFQYTVIDSFLSSAGTIRPLGAVPTATVTITVVQVPTPTPTDTPVPTETAGTAEPTADTASPTASAAAPTSTTDTVGGVTDLPDTGTAPVGSNRSILGAIVLALVLAGLGFAVRRTSRPA
jgi:hypothetical protein